MRPRTARPRGCRGSTPGSGSIRCVVSGGTSRAEQSSHLQEETKHTASGSGIQPEVHLDQVVSGVTPQVERHVQRRVHTHEFRKKQNIQVLVLVPSRKYSDLTGSILALGRVKPEVHLRDNVVK